GMEFSVTTWRCVPGQASAMTALEFCDDLCAEQQDDGANFKTDENDDDGRQRAVDHADQRNVHEIVHQQQARAFPEHRRYETTDNGAARGDANDRKKLVNRTEENEDADETEDIQQ